MGTLMLLGAPLLISFGDCRGLYVLCGCLLVLQGASRCLLLLLGASWGVIWTMMLLGAILLILTVPLSACKCSIDTYVGALWIPMGDS